MRKQIGFNMGTAQWLPVRGKGREVMCGAKPADFTC